jgi:hypothetical protein
MHQFMILLYYLLSRMLYLLHFDLVQLEQLSHLPSSAPPSTNGGTVLRRFALILARRILECRTVKT